MGQNKHVAKLNDLKGRLSKDYHLTHIVTDDKTNILTFIPVPATYNDGMIDPITKTIYPDNMITIKGPLEFVAEQFDLIINQLNGIEQSS